MRLPISPVVRGGRSKFRSLDVGEGYERDSSLEGIDQEGQANMKTLIFYFPFTLHSSLVCVLAKVESPQEMRQSRYPI